MCVYKQANAWVIIIIKQECEGTYHSISRGFIHMLLCTIRYHANQRLINTWNVSHTSATQNSDSNHLVQAHRCPQCTLAVLSHNNYLWFQHPSTQHGTPTRVTVQLARQLLCNVFPTTGLHTTAAAFVSWQKSLIKNLQRDNLVSCYRPVGQRTQFLEMYRHFCCCVYR